MHEVHVLYNMHAYTHRHISEHYIEMHVGHVLQCSRSIEYEIAVVRGHTMCMATQLYVEISHTMTGILRIPYNLKRLYTPDI